MNNYGNFPELNDTKSGVLATNGQKYRNSNPSSSATKKATFVYRTTVAFFNEINPFRDL